MYVPDDSLREGVLTSTTIQRQQERGGGGVPTSFGFAGHSPGTPMVPPSFSRPFSEVPRRATSGQKRFPEERGDDASSYSDRTKRARLDRDREKRSLKLSIRKKIMKQFLKDMQIYSYKAREPWYSFAGMYSAAMGGLVKVEDVLACFPYDFYAPTLWEKRYRLKEREGLPQYSTNARGPPGAPLEVDAEEAYETEKRKRNEVPRDTIDVDDLKNDDTKKLRAVDELASSIKDLVGKDFTHHTKTSSLDAILRASARFVLEQLVTREVKAEKKSEKEEEEDRRTRLSELQREEAGRTVPTATGTTTTTTTTIPALSSDRALYSGDPRLPVASLGERMANLRTIVRKEAEKLSEISPSYRRGIALDLDLDDIVAIPGTTTTTTKGGNYEYDDAEVFDVTRTMGENVFNPEFKGLIDLCVKNLNALSGGVVRNYTALELCTTECVNGQFAKFAALSTPPVSSKYSTKVPFSTQSYASNAGNFNGGGGNTYVIQPNQTRYVIADSKTDIKAMYQWFSAVRRRPDGSLYVISASYDYDQQFQYSNARQTRTAYDAYGKPVSRTNDELYDYGNYSYERSSKSRTRNEERNYLSTSVGTRVPVSFLL